MAGAYTVTKAADDHYRIAEGNVFMELLIGEEKAMLIDTGYGCGDLFKIVRKITDLPLIIVNTHAHPDHSCGNWQFSESVWMSEKDAPGAYLYNTPEARKNAVPVEKPDDFREAEYLKGGAGALAFTHEGQCFDLGGITVTVVDLPGHTAGSIGVLDGKNRRLFVGDAMNRAMFLFQQGVSARLPEYIKTLKKVQALDVDALWLSHMAYPLKKNDAVRSFLQCAESADFSKGFRCGSMLGTQDVRLCVDSAHQKCIDPDNVLYSVYATGLIEQGGFCGIFLSQYTAQSEN